MMKINGFKKIMLLGASVILLIAICVLCFLPFVQMENIDAEAYWGNHFDDSMHDRIQVQLTRFQLYPNCWFIHKGDTYKDIPLHDENNIQQKMSIKFNWDNSVTISKGSHTYDLRVDSVVIKSKMFPYDDYIFKQHETDDSLFVGIYMYDKKENEIAVYRQKSMMPYVGKRVGFSIIIDGKVFETGVKDFFDY